MLKVAFIYLVEKDSALAPACRGIMFVAVPHCGSASTAWLPLVQCVRGCMPQTTLASELEAGSQVLQRYAQRFDQALERIRQETGYSIPVLAIIETKRKSVVRPMPCKLHVLVHHVMARVRFGKPDLNVKCWGCRLMLHVQAF